MTATLRAGEEPVWLEVDSSPNPARGALLADASWLCTGGTSIRVPNEPG